MKEHLELVPRDREKGFYIMSPLVLLPAEADLVPKKGRSKKNLGRPHSSSSSKIVLTLLTEVVAVYMRLPAIYVRGAGLQLFLGHLEDNGSLDGSENGSGNRNGSLSF